MAVSAVLMSARRCRVPCLLALMLAVAGCGKQDDAYRGTVFDMQKPSIDWTLVSQRHDLSLPAPAYEKGKPFVGKSKVIELLHRDLRSAIEVYFVFNGATNAKAIMAVLQRRGQRKSFRLGEAKSITVGGRKGTAAIGSWRQKRGAPVQHCYSVHVPVGPSLWCFVAVCGEDTYAEAVGEFQAALRSVKFHVQ